jgi:hypothetical protein
MAEAARKPRLETGRDEGEGGRCCNVDIPSARRSRPGWPVPKRIIYYIDCFSRELANLCGHRQAGPQRDGCPAAGRARNPGVASAGPGRC